MTHALFAPAFTEQIAVPAGQFSASIQSFSQDLQTGLIDVHAAGLPRFYLLLAGGQLVNIYRTTDQLERLEPSGWAESLNIFRIKSFVRLLTLTPQAVRVLKIMIEQKDDRHGLISGSGPIEAQFARWMEHPVPALAHVLWPNAEALVLFPGQGSPPRYTLFVAANQILHSAGSVMAVYGWKEPYRTATLYSSEPRTLAWTEFMLNHGFSGLVNTMLDKFEQITGRILLNQVIRDVNFAATAHSWNIRLDAKNFTDQSIFSSPQSAAEVYTRLLKVLLRHFDSALGAGMLNHLISESLQTLTPAYRAVLMENLPILQPRQV